MGTAQLDDTGGFKGVIYIKPQVFLLHYWYRSFKKCKIGNMILLDAIYIYKVHDSSHFEIFLLSCQLIKFNSSSYI